MSIVVSTEAVAFINDTGKHRQDFRRWLVYWRELGLSEWERTWGAGKQNTELALLFSKVYSGIVCISRVCSCIVFPNLTDNCSVSQYTERVSNYTDHTVFLYVANTVVFVLGMKFSILISTCIILLIWHGWDQIRSDQISHSVVSDSLRPRESQHARPLCPSPTPGVHSDSRPSSQ